MTENCPYCMQEIKSAKDLPIKVFPENCMVMFGEHQKSFTVGQIKLMDLFVEKLNQPLHALQLQEYIYRGTKMRSIQAVWGQIDRLSKRLTNTGYKIEHIDSSTWRLCKDEPIRQSNRDNSGA